MLVTNAGKAAHFSETEVRSMGRTAKGVRGIKLDKDSKLFLLLSLKKTHLYSLLVRMVMVNDLNLLILERPEEALKVSLRCKYQKEMDN